MVADLFQAKYGFHIGFVHILNFFRVQNMLYVFKI